MEKKKNSIDIVNEILEECILAYPVSSFVISLYKQYLQRGSLSKKQLQGLLKKAAKIPDISPGKLATLEALILKMPTRIKSALPTAKPTPERDETSGKIMHAILEKYPQHKTVLFLKSKYDREETLTTAELSELRRLAKSLRLL